MNCWRVSRKRALIGLVCLLPLVAAGFLLAQAPTLDDMQLVNSTRTAFKRKSELIHTLRQALAKNDNKLTAEELMKQNEKELSALNATMNNGYREIAERPAATTDFIQSELFSCAFNLADAKSDAESSQISAEASLHLQALQVAQNARIIQLLERLTKQKKEVTAFDK